MGREVIDRFLPLVPELLSPRGVCYLVTVRENAPGDILRLMARHHRLDAAAVRRARAGPWPSRTRGRRAPAGRAAAPDQRKCTARPGPSCRRNERGAARPALPQEWRGARERRRGANRIGEGF
eukprot:scaffold3582_cov335-Prasinococcus_capsulatus_cf.AAC.2